MTEVANWWAIAEKIGAGAAFVLGVTVAFLWRAYAAELAYSKTRDTQTLTVLLNLTNIVENLENRDKEAQVKSDADTAALLSAINSLKDLIYLHYSRLDKRPT